MIDPKRTLSNILRSWGHNILVQRLLDQKPMTYGQKMQKYTVRAVYPGAQRIC